MGSITRDVVKRSFRKSIGARAIQTFLECHAHPQARRRRATRARRRVWGGWGDVRGVGARALSLSDLLERRARPTPPRNRACARPKTPQVRQRRLAEPSRRLVPENVIDQLFLWEQEENRATFEKVGEPRRRRGALRVSLSLPLSLSV